MIGQLQLNVLHRTGEYPSFDLDLLAVQQQIAHAAGLRTTLLMSYSALFSDDAVRLAQQAQAQYGDEIGIALNTVGGPQFEARFGISPLGTMRPYWLYSQAQKQEIAELIFEQFYLRFGFFPSALSSYYLDAPTINWLKRHYPTLEVVVATCFEEGTKVYRGCNYAWNLYSEGGHWSPWIPSTHHAQVPALGTTDDSGVVGLPHLNRDMFLCVEDRDDYFSSHPMNIMRGLAFDGDDYPYLYNFIDESVLQARYNSGFAYCNVFASAFWMKPVGYQKWFDGDNHRLENIYRDCLNYYGELKARGLVVDMTMTEYARWFRAAERSSRSVISLWDDILCGTDRQMFWYADPALRVTIDPLLGGTITDLRPWIGRPHRPVGADSPFKSDGSYPYLLHQGYRGAFSLDGNTRSGFEATLVHNGESRSLTTRHGQGKVERHNNSTVFTLNPLQVIFSDEVNVQIVTRFTFAFGGTIQVERELIASSDPNAQIEIRESFNGIYGTTEYSADLEGIVVYLETEEERISFDHDGYQGRTALRENVQWLGLIVPEINTEVQWKLEQPGQGQIMEAHLFTMMYVLRVTRLISIGQPLISTLTLHAIN